MRRVADPVASVGSALFAPPLAAYTVGAEPPQAQPIVKYASLLFSRPAFRESLSDAEQEMRLL